MLYTFNLELNAKFIAFICFFIVNYTFMYKQANIQAVMYTSFKT